MFKFERLVTIIREGKIQLIRGMHKNVMPLEDIAKFTSPSTEEIRK